MKIFLGHSFADEFSTTIEEIKKYLESLGHQCISGEKSENTGISDKVKKRIEECDVFLGIFNREKEIVGEEPKSYTTSNWVLQESGFAIGKEKDTIFLVENGIYKFPKLQGDLEVIFFDHNMVSKKFTNLNHMLNSLDEHKKITEDEKKEYSELVSEDKSDGKIKTPETFDKSTLDEEKVEMKLSKAIFEEKDYSKARKIFEEEKDTKEEADQIILYAKVLRWCHSIGDSEAINDLKMLSNEQNNPKVDFELAKRYEEMMEYQIAGKMFMDINEKLNLAEDDDLKYSLDCYKGAAFCLASDNQCDRAYLLLSELVHKDEFKKDKALILSELADIANLCEDFDRMILYGEISLSIDPANTSLRFKVAYEHGKLGHNELSLLHYLKLVNTEKTDVALNNLGVAYNRLKLPIKAIKCYSESAEFKATLPMANLARLYLDSGFIKDGANLLDNANKLSKEGIKINGKVGLEKSRIDGIIKAEDNKKKEILVQAEEERKFMVKQSNALISCNEIDVSKINGLWSIESVNVQLEIINNKFKVNNKFIKKDKKSEWSLLENDDETYYRIRTISLNGTVDNFVGKYEIKIEEKGAYGIYTHISCQAEGYLIIDKDYNSIDVMEKRDNKLKIKEWRKIN